MRHIVFFCVTEVLSQSRRGIELLGDDVRLVAQLAQKVRLPVGVDEHVLVLLDLGQRLL